MSGMEWILDIFLVILLAATLFYAVRLERALGVLKRDRAELETLVTAFNGSTRAAEAGIERLHVAADGSGRQIQRLIDIATTLKEDLTFLVQRGEGLADRLDEGVRAARPAVPGVGRPAVRSLYPSQSNPSPIEPSKMATPIERATHEAEPQVRSQAERDLLKALRMVR
jgi:hypothetical protein